MCEDDSGVIKITNSFYRPLYSFIVSCDLSTFTWMSLKNLIHININIHIYYYLSWHADCRLNKKTIYSPYYKPKNSTTLGVFESPVKVMFR